MDHIDITNLVYQVAEHLDQGQPEAAAELFRHARVRLREDGEPLNCEQLLQVWQQGFGARDDEVVMTRHNISNPIVEIDREQGSARCHSRYLLLRCEGDQPLQVVSAGRYRDEFVRENDDWRFASRQCLIDQGEEPGASPVITESSSPAPSERSGPTREKILAAAQQVFSNVGYSEAGIRRIAEVVGLSPTILLRHFGTKAGLFEAALVESMGGSRPLVDKAEFGQHVANMLADPTQINCPHAMSLLATGNEEAREITIRVLKQYTILPMMEWLGEPHRESRAKQIMALCAGFALYNTRLNISDTHSIDHQMVDWLAKSIQAIVDQAA